MFGHQDDNQQQSDSSAIPDHAIDAALSEDHQQTTSWGHPGTPLDDDHPAAVSPTAPPATVTPSDSPTPATPVDTNALLDIKQKALSQLAPLVGHLEQSPEEKFRTMMMMIQASDDQSKLKEAYSAALEIHDEKDRAQALLDVVNEINYFTQGHEN